MMFEATKESLAELLDELALLLDLSGENVFRVRAHQRAADSVRAWEGTAGELLAAANAGNVAGIGPQILHKLKVVAETGTLPELDSLRATFPTGVREMLRVPGLGPKKVKALVADLHITDLEELRHACVDGRVASLKGFGLKTQQRILLGVEQVESFRGLHTLDAAIAEGARFMEHLSNSGLCSQISYCGEVRRFCEVVNTVDLLVVCPQPFQLMEELASLPEITDVRARDEAHVSVGLRNGLIVSIWEARPQEAAVRLFELTGSDEHILAVQEYAAFKGLRIADGQLLQGLRPIEVADEESLYETLGLQFVPPELRETREFVTRAASRSLPRLVEPDDIKGMLHVHTTYSDGRNTLREMALATKGLGYEYLGVTDHSQSAAYAHGLSPERLREQRREIDKLNEELAPFRIFAGIESDIRSDGSLDYEANVLDELDFVIASVHSGFQMTRAEMTTRLVRAIQDPHTTILGHPTGRLLLNRKGYEIELDQVLSAAADHRVAVECNGNPYRLDLDWQSLMRAKDRGVMIAFGPDAHSAEDLGDMRFCLGVGRKAGVMGEDVLNSLSRECFLESSRAGARTSRSF